MAHRRAGPVNGIVAFVYDNPRVNTPGTLAPPPAGTVRIRTKDGMIVTMGHMTNLRAHVGDTVAVGQVLGVDGNNGNARAPHIHIRAYPETNNEPLQIRWDLRALAKTTPFAG